MYTSSTLSTGCLGASSLWGQFPGSFSSSPSPFAAGVTYSWLVAACPASNTLLQLNLGSGATLSTVATNPATTCTAPLTVALDANMDVWLACQGNLAGTTAGLGSLVLLSPSLVTPSSWSWTTSLVAGTAAQQLAVTPTGGTTPLDCWQPSAVAVNVAGNNVYVACAGDGFSNGGVKMVDYTSSVPFSVPTSFNSSNLFSNPSFTCGTSKVVVSSSSSSSSSSAQIFVSCKTAGGVYGYFGSGAWTLLPGSCSAPNSLFYHDSTTSLFAACATSIIVYVNPSATQSPSTVATTTVAPSDLFVDAAGTIYAIFIDGTVQKYIKSGGSVYTNSSIQSSGFCSPAGKALPSIWCDTSTGIVYTTCSSTGGIYSYRPPLTPAPTPTSSPAPTTTAAPTTAPTTAMTTTTTTTATTTTTMTTTTTTAPTTMVTTMTTLTTAAATATCGPLSSTLPGSPTLLSSLSLSASSSSSSPSPLLLGACSLPTSVQRLLLPQIAFTCDPQTMAQSGLLGAQCRAVQGQAQGQGQGQGAGAAPVQQIFCLTSGVWVSSPFTCINVSSSSSSSSLPPPSPPPSPPLPPLSPPVAPVPTTSTGQPVPQCEPSVQVTVQAVNLLSALSQNLTSTLMLTYSNVTVYLTQLFALAVNVPASRLQVSVTYALQVPSSLSSSSSSSSSSSPPPLTLSTLSVLVFPSPSCSPPSASTVATTLYFVLSHNSSFVYTQSGLGHALLPQTWTFSFVQYLSALLGVSPLVLYVTAALILFFVGLLKVIHLRYYPDATVLSVCTLLLSVLSFLSTVTFSVSVLSFGSSSALTLYSTCGLVSLCGLACAVLVNVSTTAWLVGRATARSKLLDKWMRAKARVMLPLLVCAAFDVENVLLASSKLFYRLWLMCPYPASTTRSIRLMSCVSLLCVNCVHIVATSLLLGAESSNDMSLSLTLLVLSAAVAALKGIRLAYLCVGGEEEEEEGEKGQSDKKKKGAGGKQLNELIHHHHASKPSTSLSSSSSSSSSSYASSVPSSSLASSSMTATASTFDRDQMTITTSPIALQMETIKS